MKIPPSPEAATRFTRMTVLIAMCFFVATPVIAQQSVETEFRPNTFVSDAVEFPPQRIGAIEIADIDGDGWLDVYGVNTYTQCFGIRGDDCNTVSEQVWIRNNRSKLPFGEESDFTSNRFTLEKGVDWEVIPAPADRLDLLLNEQALGDIDADGDLDLITYGELSGQFYVNRFSGGQPAFDAFVRIPTDIIDFANSFELADLDNDDDLDILVFGSDLLVLINNGSPTTFGPFAEPVAIAEAVFSSQIFSLASPVVDIDNDGDLDLLVRATTNDPTGNTIHFAGLMINDGSVQPFNSTTPVQFIGPVSENSDSVFQDLTALDGDDDGDLDLVAELRNGGTDPSVHYLTNRGAPEYFGDNNLGNVIATPDTMFQVHLATADLNGDRHDDVFVSTFSVQGSKNFVLLNQGGDAPFAGEPVPVVPEIETGRIIPRFGDLDNDGDTDFTGFFTESFGLYLNNGFTGTPMPVISTTYPQRVDESDGSVDVTFTLDSPQSEAVRVQFGTLSGTATRGEDFYGVFEVVEFMPGETERSVRIGLVDDDIPEDPETLNGRLAFAQGANLATRLVSINIEDDDTEQATLNLGDARASEVDGVLEIPIQLDRAVGVPVSVAAATQDRTGDGYASAGDDYWGKYEVLTIPAGQTRAVFRVSVLKDSIRENNEKVLVRLFNPQNATINKAWALGVITAP